MDDVKTRPARAEAIQAAIAAQKQISHCLFSGNIPEWVHLELSMGQLKTLMTLASKEALTVSGLAETLNVGKPAASILVDRLVQLGLVERTEDPEDRRRTLVTLTEAGIDLVARLRQGGPGRMLRWLEQLDDEDLAALVRGMRALAAFAEREAAEAGTQWDPSAYAKG
jgi:DNA-binding MarR family transcriptional regulator